MYSRLISKMSRHFSELGSIIYSKSCDFYNINEISRDDITMYYDVLNTPDVEFPEKVSKNNHIACCLYYLSKEDKKYYDVFLNKFLANLSFSTLKTNEENLILIFNIIEFDKTFLNSGKDHIEFLYKLNMKTPIKNILKLFLNYLNKKIQITC